MCSTCTAGSTAPTPYPGHSPCTWAGTHGVPPLYPNGVYVFISVSYELSYPWYSLLYTLSLLLQPAVSSYFCSVSYSTTMGQLVVTVSFILTHLCVFVSCDCIFHSYTSFVSLLVVTVSFILTHLMYLC